MKRKAQCHKCGTTLIRTFQGVWKHRYSVPYHDPQPDIAPRVKFPGLVGVMRGEPLKLTNPDDTQKYLAKPENI